VQGYTSSVGNLYGTTNTEAAGTAGQGVLRSGCILRIVDSTGKVYDKYSPKTGGEAGPMAGMGGLLIGLALVVVIAGIGGAHFGTI